MNSETKQSSDSDKTYDIVLFGATSFVGKILARELASALTEDDSLSWAIAGRSEQKLLDLQKTLNSQTSVNILIADSNDQQSLYNLCRKTRIVFSCVGPYALYGENLLQACVDTGTDYCDLCGESQWLLKMLSKYQSLAEESGARIVPSCGFDCVPSDLGVLYLQNQAQQTFGQTCDHIRMRVKTLKGKFSGGTYASMMQLIKEVSETPALKKALASPYCFCPSNHPYSVEQEKIRVADFEEDSESWVAPFIMEGINTRTVHRSNALLDHQYGDEFHYSEAILTGSGRRGRKRASRITYGMGLLFLAATFAPLRSLLNRFFLPAPGEGPSSTEQEKGHYEMLFLGKASGRGRVEVRLSGDKDPGYGSTAKIAAQALVYFANECPKNKTPGGFWTPASIFGLEFLKRLESHAGIRVSVVESTKL